jgi:hypothetical protein
MAGLPLSRASSPDGRWAYTLYDADGGEPFVHALDTVGRTAVCIDLPQLARVPSRHAYLLQIQIRDGGRELAVLKRVPGPSPTRQPLSIDTQSFEVTRPGVETTGVGGSAPWAAIGIAATLLLVALVGATRGRRGAPTA